MNNSLQVELKLISLQMACKKVEESERLVEELLAEVSSLRTVSERKQEQKKTDGDSTPAQSKENVLLCEAMKTLPWGSSTPSTGSNLPGFPRA